MHTPLPAEEVRRRGDSLRRRRTALTALVSAAAVAAVTVGGVAIGDSLNGGRESGPVGQPTWGGWLSAVPDDFPLDSDLPGSEGAPGRDGYALGTLTACGVKVPLGNGQVDHLTVSGQTTGHTEGRDLRLYASESGGHPDEVATKVMDAVRRAYASCSTDTVGSTSYDYTVADLAFGDETVRVLGSDATSSGAVEWDFVRVGNAILVSVASQDAESSASGAGATATLLEKGMSPRLDNLTSLMCVFADGGCSAASHSPRPTPEPGDSPVIPEGFPLADGWPRQHEPGGKNGLAGPSRDLPAMSYDACGGSFSDSAGDRDRITATWTNPEDRRSRELTVFRTEAAATEYASALVAFYRDCPSESAGEPMTWRTTVHDTDAGIGTSWEIRGTMWGGGVPAIGISVRSINLVGRAVLVDEASSEGSGPKGAADMGDRMRAALVRPLQEMCQFTSEGCNAAGSPSATVIGPEGAAGLTLGMRLDDIKAGRYGVTNEQTAGDCTSFNMADYEPTHTGLPDAWASQVDGLVALRAAGGMVTPEGVGRGATAAEVHAAYPDLASDPDGLMTAPASANARYAFELTSGAVSDIWLELDQQSCLRR